MSCNNKESELPDEFQPPILLKLWSKCSEFSEVDLQKQLSPPRIKLRKLNSTIDQQNFEFPNFLIHKPVPLSPDQTPQEVPEENQSDKWQPCSCTKTRCLKMYCSCFHNDRLCGELCKCEDCQNKDEYKNERHSAVQHIKKKAHRNKKVPIEKIFETKEVWGCNCRKTRCLKRYCECYIRGKTCTVDCNCNQCENGKDEDLYNEIRKQNERPRHSSRIR